MEKHRILIKSHSYGKYIIFAYVKIGSKKKNRIYRKKRKNKMRWQQKQQHVYSIQSTQRVCNWKKTVQKFIWCTLHAYYYWLSILTKAENMAYIGKYYRVLIIIITIILLQLFFLYYFVFFSNAIRLIDFFISWLLLFILFISSFT